MQDTIFSSIDFVGQCLVDKKRTKLFQKAIDKVVQVNDSVLDLGTGSGIMAIFASKKAKEVTAVEFDPFVASIARNHFELNGFS